MVMVTSASDGLHGGFASLQRRTSGPPPVACVNVAPGLVALGLNEPVPPLSREQMVCAPPTVDIVGSGLTVATTSALDSAHGGFEIFQRKITGPPPVACVNVASGAPGPGLNDPPPPPATAHEPLPTAGAFPPR